MVGDRRTVSPAHKPNIVGELVVVTERLKVGGRDDLADLLRDTGES